jgi:hypothetical protein
MPFVPEPRACSLKLPFFCPIEPAIHPDVTLVEARAHDWLLAQNYFGNPENRERVIGSRSAEFYARMSPRAHTNRLQVAVEWIYWGFSFDDAYCDTLPWSIRPAEFTELAGRIVRMLEAPRSTLPGPDPHIMALAELRDRFAEVGTPVQHRRWVLAQRAWLLGVAWQIGNQSRAVMPTLNDYLAMRINSAAGESVTSMIALVNDLDIPEKEMEHPAVRACTEMSRMLASLDNDLHSYAKDIHRNEIEQNIVNVIITEQYCHPQDAVVTAMAMRDRIMCRFLSLRDRISHRQSAPTRHYLQDLGHVVRGNLDWGLKTPRYLVDGQHSLVPQWADKPSDAGTLPPAPSVAWWWDITLAGG